MCWYHANRNIFSRRLKAALVEFGLWRRSKSLFQADGPAMAKARRQPYVLSRWRGTCSRFRSSWCHDKRDVSARFTMLWNFCETFSQSILRCLMVSLSLCNATYVVFFIQMISLLVGCLTVTAHRVEDGKTKKVSFQPRFEGRQKAAVNDEWSSEFQTDRAEHQKSRCANSVLVNGIFLFLV